MRWKGVWPVLVLVVCSLGGVKALRGSALVLQARIKAEEAKLNPPVVEETSGDDGNSTGAVVGGTTAKPKPQLTGIPQKDYIYDPNLPRELKGHDLSNYPFYNSIPKDIEFECDGLHDGFYASVPHHCQVYHHCLFGTRYDFLCANYTAFDQKTFICHFVSEVDCDNSPKYYNRNEALYKAASTAPPSTTKAPTTTTTTTTPEPPSGGGGGGRIRGGGGPGRGASRRRRPHRRRRPSYEYYYDDDEEYDDQDYYEDDLPPPRKMNRKRRPNGDQQQQPKAKEGEDNAKSPAEQAPTSGNDALPAAPPASVFNKPRAPPKIRPPVPLNERHKYEYTTKPGQQAASAQPYTPSAGGKDRARGRDHQEDDLDYYDEDELEDEEEEDYEEEPPKKARKDFEATPGRGKGSSRRRGGQQSRKRPPPSRYDDDDMYDDEPERPKQRKGQHSRRTEEEYPRNRNRGLRKGYRDEDDDEMPHERYSGRGNNRRPHQQSMRSSQRSHRRPYYDEADSEEYEYYDEEEDADQYKTQRGKNGHKQSDKRLTVPSSRNKNRNRNEDDRPSPRTTSTTPAPLTTTTPSNVKSQKAKNKDIVEDKSLEDYYDEQEESTSNGKTNNNRDDHPTTTAKNRPNIPVKYTFKPRQEVTPTILAHRSSTVTSSTTHLTTPTPATVPETTRTEPPKRFRMPIEIKLKMKPVLNGRSKVAASDAQEKTSSEKLESSAEVSQRPQQEVEVTTRYSAPVRQLINRRLVRPSTVSSEEDEQAPASSPPQPAQQKGVSFHTRRPSGQSEEAPQSNQQGAVLRRPIKVVVDQPRKYPAEFAIKPDYSSIEQPRGFANGRRPPPIALTTEAQELPTQTGTGLNYRNPFKPLETDLEEEEKSVEQPRTENGPPLGFNYRRPYKTKEPEETRNSQSQEDFETERPQILTRRPFKPKVVEQQDNNPKPALEQPTRAPQVQESRRPLQRLPEPIADIPTGPAQDPSGFRKQEIANPPRTYAFFNTRPKRPPTEERDQIFPPQRPKLIEVTAPGPSAPSEDSTIRPGIVQQQQQNYNNGFHGLDFADEEYDVTLNDALQPSTLHPTQSLLGGSSEIQSFQPRVKTRGFQSAITHPSYTNRGSATYLIPSASQQFYSKVQQEAPPDSIPQGTILDTREYEAIVVPAPRFNQPRFKQRTRPREWFW